jgi:flavodoxin
MVKALVVYGSKYGSTQEVARAIADGLGADLANAASQPNVQPYDLVVIGSPIYGGNYLESVLEFVRANRPLLEKTRIAAFITAAADMEPQVGLTGEQDEMLYTQQEYADGLGQLTGGKVIGSRGFGGRLIPAQLSPRDRNMLDWFYRFLMHEPLKGFDLLDIPSAIRWGEDLREAIGG